MIYRIVDARGTPPDPDTVFSALQDARRHAKSMEHRTDLTHPVRIQRATPAWLEHLETK